MKLRRARLTTALCSVFVLLILLPVAMGARCTAADMVFISRWISAWPLAYSLGDAHTAREVYARLPAEEQAQYYVLLAQAGRPIIAELSVPDEPALRRAGLRMALTGPALPAAALPPGARPMPGDGTVYSQEPPRGEQDATQAVTEARYRVLRVLAVNAPVRGRCVLTVHRTGERGIAVPYRLVMAGACGYDVGTFAWLPVRWVQASYFIWPKRTIGRLLVLLAGAGATLGLSHIGAQRRAALRAGPVR